MKAFIKLQANLHSPSLVGLIESVLPRRRGVLVLKRRPNKRIRPPRRTTARPSSSSLDSFIQAGIDYVTSESVLGGAGPKYTALAVALGDYLKSFLGSGAPVGGGLAAGAAAPVDFADVRRPIVRSGVPFPTPKGVMVWTEDKPGYWVLRQGEKELGASVRVRHGLRVWAAVEADGVAEGPDALFDSWGAVLGAVLDLAEHPPGSVGDALDDAALVAEAAGEELRAFIDATNADDAERAAESVLTPGRSTSTPTRWGAWSGAPPAPLSGAVSSQPRRSGTSRPTHS